MTALRIIWLLMTSARYSLQQSEGSTSISAGDPQSVPTVFPAVTISDGDVIVFPAAQTTRNDSNSSRTNETIQTTKTPSNTKVAAMDLIESNQTRNEFVTLVDEINPFEIYPTKLNSTSSAEILIEFVTAALEVEHNCAASVIFDDGFSSKMDDIAKHVSAERRGYSVQVSHLRCP